MCLNALKKLNVFVSLVGLMNMSSWADDEFRPGLSCASRLLRSSPRAWVAVLGPWSRGCARRSASGSRWWVPRWPTALWAESSWAGTWWCWVRAGAGPRSRWRRRRSRRTGSPRRRPRSGHSRRLECCSTGSCCTWSIWTSFATRYRIEKFKWLNIGRTGLL